MISPGAKAPAKEAPTSREDKDEKACEGVASRGVPASVNGETEDAGARRCWRSGLEEREAAQHSAGAGAQLRGGFRAASNRETTDSRHWDACAKMRADSTGSQHALAVAVRLICLTAWRGFGFGGDCGGGDASCSRSDPSSCFAGSGPAPGCAFGENVIHDEEPVPGKNDALKGASC